MPREHLTPPPSDLISDRAVRKLLDEHVRLGAELLAANDAEHEAVRRRVRAVEQDVQALADAKRAGKPDPGDANLRKVDSEIAAQRREAAALLVAVRDSRAELERAIGAKRAALTASLDDRESELRAQLVDALDALHSTYAQLAKIIAAKAWLRDPKRPFATGGIGRVAGLGSWATVLAALRDSTRQPEAPAIEPLRPPDRRVSDIEVSDWWRGNGGKAGATLGEQRARYLEDGPRRDDFALDMAEIEAYEDPARDSGLRSRGRAAA